MPPYKELVHPKSLSNINSPKLLIFVQYKVIQQLNINQFQRLLHPCSNPYISITRV